jgi:hypothetical protein
MIAEYNLKNSLKIMLKLYNPNTDELFYYYRKFGIKEVKFLYFRFKKEKLDALLSAQKYEYIELIL